MIFIQRSEKISSPIDDRIIELAVTQTLDYNAVSPEVDLTIVLTDDEQLHQLNLQFLGIDAPTDVLSFPADVVDPDSHRRYLGDVLVSIPRAEAQAATAGQSARQEALLLVVHGVLHLLGYDHAEEGEKARMWAAQDEILSRI